MGNKILIINCGAGGDILNCTPIVKHHKIVEPDCQITWLTSKKYVHILKNNKNIDNILIYENIHTGDDLHSYVNMTFFIEQNEKELFSKYDIVKFVAPYYYSLKNRIELSRQEDNLLNIIKYKTSGITNFACDFIPNIFLTQEEKLEAQHFVKSINNDKNKFILLEYENFSNQSPFNLNYIKILCDFAEDRGYSIIFSGKNKPEYFDSLAKKYGIDIHFYNGSFMSNAELYNLVDMFIGCCSGLSCLTHSDFCDISKPRIEVTHGLHWSSFEWKHMQNKTIVTTIDQFKESLKNCI
jgi:ADP-heptose:LPS heptosyltransferase